MNIQATNQSISQIPFVPEIENKSEDTQETLDREMEIACKSYDPKKIASLVRSGANLDQTILVNHFDTFKIIEHVDDPKLVDKLIYQVLGPVWEAISSITDKPKSEQTYIDRFKQAISDGRGLSLGTSLKIMNIIADLMPLFLSEKELEILNEPDELTLFDFAFATRSIDLIEALFERGETPSDEELEASDLLDNDHFTEKSEKIIEYLISKGLQLDQLLEEEDTLEDFMESALFLGDMSLVEFLEKHGVSKEVGSIDEFGVVIENSEDPSDPFVFQATNVDVEESLAL